MLRQAAGLLEHGLSLCPDSPIAQLHLASIYLRIGKYGESERLARKLVAAHPNSTDSQLVLADSLLRQNRREESGKLIMDIIKREPLNAEALKLGGELEIASANFTNALKFLDYAARFKPNDSLLFIMQGDAYQGLRKPKNALAPYREALRLNPRSYRATAGLASAYRALQETDKAIDYYRQSEKFALKINRTYDRPFNELSEYFVELGRIPEAKANIELTMKEIPQSPNAHYLYSKILREEGNIDAALAQATEAARLAPNTLPECHYQLGLLLAKKGRKQEAQEQFEIVKRLEKNSQTPRRNDAKH